jgi:hypothetical protein
MTGGVGYAPLSVSDNLIKDGSIDDPRSALKIYFLRRVPRQCFNNCVPQSFLGNSLS